MASAGVPTSAARFSDRGMVSEVSGSHLQSGSVHGCCREAFLFASCGAVVEIEIHLAAKIEIAAPLPTSIKSCQSESTFGSCEVFPFWSMFGRQGPPVVPFAFFFGLGSPTKIDYTEKKGTRILNSLLVGGGHELVKLFS